jgi:hypothetical protein
MGLLSMWREARGDVMRQMCDDIFTRIQSADEPALRAFYNNVVRTIEPLREAYRPASSRDRKAILAHCRKSANEMWARGDWPSALGLGITALNVESEFVPGKDAAYVRTETEKVIVKASEYFTKGRTSRSEIS